MVFSSLSFIYIFLPITLLLYFIVPKKLKNTVLLLMSLAFYFAGERALVLVMLFSAIINYGIAMFISHFESKFLKKSALIVALIINLGMLGYFKYCDFFIENINALFGSSLELLKIALPIGISFYTFQSLSYVIDVYRGTVSAQRNPINLATYITLFPQLIAGPIVRYETVSAELCERTHSLENFSYGVRRFVIGLSKKVLLANTFAELIKEIGYSEEKTVIFCWLTAIAFTFQIYFDFSGYSDMAIGLGRMLGFHFDENFNYPYISASITEFWRRWHISLGTWFRDYVYIPLGGNRKGKLRQVLNILIVWLLTGFWHGAQWTFILWGLLYGVLLLSEKFITGKLLARLPRVIGVIYTLLFVILGFVLFSSDNPTSAFESIAAMFGFSALPLYGAQTVYLLKSFAVVLVIAAVAATPLVSKLLPRLNKKVLNTAEPIACAVLLFLCTAYLVDGSFNPFLYFRF